MRDAHTLGAVNLELVRTFLSVAEVGSLSQVAELQRVSQSTLTRQMNALEQEIGGRLLERSPSGVTLTATGHALRETMGPLLAEMDRALASVRQHARGQQSTLQVGYLLSAGPRYLHPALARLRREHPEVKVTLRDQSPGEQIAALRRGERDVAMVGQSGTLLTREFYVKQIAVLPVVVALAETHPLAARESIGLAELREAEFVSLPEADMPGYNPWLVQLCRRAGFRPRFTADAESLTHSLALVVTENAVTLLPDYTRETALPGVVYRPLLTEPMACWQLIVAWQRGRTSRAAKSLVAALVDLGRV